MDNFITQKVELILISPFEASPLTPVVARAVKTGFRWSNSTANPPVACGDVTARPHELSQGLGY